MTGRQPPLALPLEGLSKLGCPRPCFWKAASSGCECARGVAGLPSQCSPELQTYTSLLEGVLRHDTGHSNERKQRSLVQTTAIPESRGTTHPDTCHYHFAEAPLQVKHEHKSRGLTSSTKSIQSVSYSIGMNSGKQVWGTGCGAKGGGRLTGQQRSGLP